MFVDFKKFERHTLTEKQRTFLLALIPMTVYVQENVIAKSAYARPPRETKSGVLACVLSAHCAYKSDWGNHFVARDRCHAIGATTWVHGNNLGLLKPNDFWRRRTIELDGVKYKSYDDWSSFAIDWSDVLSWTEDYSDVLLEHEAGAQIKLMAKRDEDPVSYEAAVMHLVKSLGLREFDLHA